jgi:hypothetical protein
MNKTILSLLVAVGLISSASAQVLFQDDFSGFNVDPNNWIVSLPYSGSQAVQNNGYISLINRGTLVSNDLFPQNITISGTFTFNSPYDYLTVTTRSSGNVVDPNLYNERDGISFSFYSPNVIAANGGGQSMYIVQQPSQQDAGILLAQNNSLSFNPGTQFSYSITDAGTYAEVFIDGNNILSTSLDPSFNPGSHIAIYNREGWQGDSSTTLGAITVTAVPEPSTYALFGIGALALIVAYRRKVA